MRGDVLRRRQLRQVHPREVFKSALLSSCASIILVHNHPSGIPVLSLDDERMTRRLCECGSLLGIEVLDSIIIGEEAYYSFSEAGLMDRYAVKASLSEKIKTEPEVSSVCKLW